MRSNKGVTLIDVIIGLIILSLFVGVIGGLFYKIAYNTNLISYNSFATYYAVRISEEIDKMAYNDVKESNISNFINENFDLPDSFNISVKVKKYNENDSSKLDILKIVLVEVDYSFFDRDFKYQLKKLKVREI